MRTLRLALFLMLTRLHLSVYIVRAKTGLIILGNALAEKPDYIDNDAIYT